MVGRIGLGCCCEGTPACPGGYPTSIDEDFSADPFTGVWGGVVTGPITETFSGTYTIATPGPAVTIYQDFNSYRPRPWTDQPSGIWDSADVSFELTTLEAWDVALSFTPAAYNINNEASIRFSAALGRVSLTYWFTREYSVDRWYNRWRLSATAVPGVNPSLPGGGLCFVTIDSGLTTSSTCTICSAGDVIKATATRISGTTGQVELFQNGSSLGSHSATYTWLGNPYPSTPWDQPQCQKSTGAGYLGRIPRLNGVSMSVDDLLMETNTV